MTRALMVFAEDIRKVILKIADERGAGNSFSPREIANRVPSGDKGAVLEQVYFVASVLIQEGKIASIRGSDHTPELPRYMKKV